MKFFILILCFLFPFALAYLIKATQINIFVTLVIIILFTISNAIHPVDKWHKSLNSGVFYENIEYGKEFLINNFSNRQEYFDEGKDKIEEISK